MYEEETRPVEQVFRGRVPFFEINGIGEIDEVQQRLLDALSEAEVRGV